MAGYDPLEEQRQKMAAMQAEMQFGGQAGQQNQAREAQSSGFLNAPPHGSFNRLPRYDHFVRTESVPPLPNSASPEGLTGRIFQILARQQDLDQLVNRMGTVVFGPAPEANDSIEPSPSCMDATVNIILRKQEDIINRMTSILANL